MTKLTKVRLRERSDPENEDKAMASQVLEASKLKSLEADFSLRVVRVNGSRVIPWEAVAFMDEAPDSFEPKPMTASDPAFRHPKAKR